MRQTYLLILLILTVTYHVTGRLQLVNNGYEGLTVVIKENVQEDPKLINRIQDAFTRFSQKMYIATNNRAYLRNVTLVLPKSWTLRNASTDASAVTSGTQIIVIESRGKGTNVDPTPYVTGNTDCGIGGRTMNVDPRFFQENSNLDQYGPLDNVLLHEWGHLRWGLFDEYPSVPKPGSRGRKDFVQFYWSGGEWQPVRCTRSVRGVRRTSCGAKEAGTTCSEAERPDHCHFCPVELQQTQASLMYGQWLPSMFSFCDKDGPETDKQHRHNSEAVNLQNRNCEGQSAWEVMRKHEDFARDANPPGASDLDTTPRFRVVRQSGRVRVFVLDVSGSMNDENRLVLLRQAVELVVRTIIETGSRLGMVQFSTTAQILVPLTKMESYSDKEAFIARIPRAANGGTSIGSGLLKALEVLSSEDKSQCEIILITDGENTDFPDISDVRPDLISAGVVVHTIAVSQAADSSLKNLAEITEGIPFTYLGPESTSFADILYQAAAPDVALADSSTPEILFSKSFTTFPGSPINGSFTVDDGLGNSTTITVMAETDTSIHLTLTGPANFRYTETKSNTRTAFFDLSVHEMSGVYSFMVTTQSQGKVNIVITSKPTSSDSAVLRVTSWFSNNTIDYIVNSPRIMYAEVRKGGKPVLDADVTAILESGSSSQSVRIKLTDNGASNIDKIAYDGIYSAAIINDYLKQDGRYSVKVECKGGNQTFTWSPADGSRANINPSYNVVGVNEVEEKIGQFNRLSLPGELTVVNYDPSLPDITPPARIQDLQLEGFTLTQGQEEKSMTFTFTWTAVGDDMEVGQASSYDMALRPNLTYASDIEYGNSKRSINVTIFTPQLSGERETLNLTLTQEECDGTCYTAIRAVDDDDNKGAWSNSVAVDVNFPVPEQNAKDVSSASSVGPVNFVMVLLLALAPLLLLK